MEKVGVLLVSKCLSAAAMIDALSRSERYQPQFYVVERQPNPFNRSRAKSHAVVPDLAVSGVVQFVRKLRGRIDFGLTDTEDFVVAGGRDALERETGVPMICVSKKYAVEGSKADQRALFERVFPGANPEYRVFDPGRYSSSAEAVSDFKRFTSGLHGFALKPDAPARGAGVGVWGRDFGTDDEAAAFFRNVYSKGKVVVEERIEGEESSFHAFSDGKHFVPAPLSRDYKRALDGNKGRLTGGMGSYRSNQGRLPFVTSGEWDDLVAREEHAFRKWKGSGSQPGLRGVVLYDAIMHTGRGFKVLERNSRGGNTEFISLLTTMEDDFVEVCYRILEGTLKAIRFRRQWSVVTCAVPASYGIPAAKAESAATVDLASAYDLSMRGDINVFPMDLKEEGGHVVMGTSRAVAVAGLGRTADEARARSLRGVEALVGPLRWRTDIAARSDLAASSAHMRELRASA